MITPLASDKRFILVSLMSGDWESVKRHVWCYNGWASTGAYRGAFGDALFIEKPFTQPIILQVYII